MPALPCRKNIAHLECTGKRTMRERELEFDQKKHMLYSKSAKKVIQAHLRARYPPEEAEQYWTATQKTYVEILELIPYMGGKQNKQAGSVYDCAALFAFYKAVPEKPDLEEFEHMNEELFLPPFHRAKLFDLNRPILAKAARWIWTTLAKCSAAHSTDWPGNYHMEMQPCPEGTKYVFLRCPIAELAKKLGYTSLMPAMCNPDYPMLRCMHAGLIRRTTCANGDCCDFWIVGDRSHFLKEHPCRKSEDGYLYNE